MTVRLAMAMLLLATTTAFAGPFGLNKGTSRTQAKAEAPNANGFSPIPEVPARHPNLVVYSGKFGPQSGLCMIVAASKDFENDRYGESVREAFDLMRSQLDATYGHSDLFDSLRTGALWDDANEWVMSIQQNERSFQASWDAESGAELKDGIVEILLTVRGFDSTTADYALQYRFDNERSCDEEIAAQGRSVL